jgi:hypothetical protein
MRSSFSRTALKDTSFRRLRISDAEPVLGWEDPSGLEEDDKPLVQILGDGMRVPTQAEVELNDPPSLK